MKHPPFALVILALAILSGCAGANKTLNVTTAVLDLFGEPEPTPVCDKDNTGVRWQGKQCMKMSDDTYQWVKED